MKLKATVRTYTGKTRHLVGGADMAHAIASVLIEAADNAFYLLYFDREGNGLTDTWHQSMEEAKHQANFEFGLVEADWEESEQPRCLIGALTLNRATA